MRAQLEKAGTPAPMAIGIDEISVGDGHDYRIVVSDLVRGRATAYQINLRRSLIAVIIDQFAGDSTAVLGLR
jgi:hypothetical protein